MDEAIATLSRTDVEMTRVARSVPFDTINSPGAYVCNWSGHLMRIPERTLVPGETLRLNIVGSEPLTVTKISDDPGVPLPTARTLAARLGVRTGF